MERAGALPSAQNKDGKTRQQIQQPLHNAPGSELSSTVSDSHTYVKEKLIDISINNGRDADIMSPR